MRVIVQLFFIHLFSIALVSAQITTEEILIKNDTIELPGTLSYSKKKQPIINLDSRFWKCRQKWKPRCYGKGQLYSTI